MQRTFHRVDVVAALAAAAQHNPDVSMEFQRIFDMILRAPSERWLVSDGPIDTNAPVPWALCAKGEQLAIPMVPYLLDPAPDKAMGFVFEQGLYVGQTLPRVAKRLHISLGVPVQQVSHPITGQPALRLYMGFAVLPES